MEAKTVIDWLMGVLGAVVVPALVWAGMILGLVLIVRDKLWREHSPDSTPDPERSLVTFCQWERNPGEIETRKLHGEES